MAIVLDITPPSGKTATKLQADIARWLNRTDLGDDIPTFIELAESRIDTDLRVRQMEVEAVLEAVNGKSAPLPDDWLAFKTISIAGQDPLDYITPERRLEELRCPSGQIEKYTTIGERVYFVSESPTAFNADCVYYKAPPSLSSNSTNWLLSWKPNVYLYAALAEASLFLKKKDDANHWGGLYSSLVAALNAESKTALSSGSRLRIRPR